MSILDHHKENFDTLIRAVKSGDVCLLDVERKSDNKSVAALCAVNYEDNDEVSFVPLAIMVEGNPYEMYAPPDVDGGYHGEEESDNKIEKSCEG